MLTKEAFDKVRSGKEGFNRIPLMREVLADLDTPLSVYLKLANGPYSYLFESVHGGEKWGRYSIIGLPARTVLRVNGTEINVIQDGKTIERESVADPLDFVQQFKSRYRVPTLPGLPRFTGGLVGYFGYETIRYIEPRLGDMRKPDAVGVPDILLMVSDEVIVFDNLTGKLYVVVHVDPAVDDAYRKGQQRLDELQAGLGDMPRQSSPASQRAIREEDFVSAFKQKEFEQAVEKALEYVRAGDIMQVVLSQRLSVAFEAPPLDLYRCLRSVNPSPYMYYLNLDDFHIVGSSPEILVRIEEGEVTVRPIAGTRRRGKDEAEDKAMHDELLADPKERAEHIMLVDLGRNDIGRVAQTGTVRVTDCMTIERYSHVMHIVSNVVGRLGAGFDAMSVLRATFPAGTVSGAAKVRAMEIINELEPTRRGVYAGAIGYLSWSGNMDTAIAIRTAVIKDGTLYTQAGAGIVADSVPRLEWKETMNKARAIFRAAAMASSGLNGRSEE